MLPPLRRNTVGMEEVLPMRISLIEIRISLLANFETFRMISLCDRKMTILHARGSSLLPVQRSHRQARSMNVMRSALNERDTNSLGGTSASIGAAGFGAVSPSITVVHLGMPPPKIELMELFVLQVVFDVFSPISLHLFQPADEMGHRIAQGLDPDVSEFLLRQLVSNAAIGAGNRVNPGPSI